MAPNHPAVGCGSRFKPSLSKALPIRLPHNPHRPDDLRAAQGTVRTALSGARAGRANPSAHQWRSQLPARPCSSPRALLHRPRGSRADVSRPGGFTVRLKPQASAQDLSWLLRGGLPVAQGVWAPCWGGGGHPVLERERPGSALGLRKRKHTKSSQIPMARAPLLLKDHQHVPTAKSDSKGTEKPGPSARGSRKQRWGFLHGCPGFCTAQRAEDARAYSHGRGALHAQTGAHSTHAHTLLSPQFSVCRGPFCVRRSHAEG